MAGVGRTTVLENLGRRAPDFHAVRHISVEPQLSSLVLRLQNGLTTVLTGGRDNYGVILRTSSRLHVRRISHVGSAGLPPETLQGKPFGVFFRVTGQRQIRDATLGGASCHRAGHLLPCQDCLRASSRWMAPRVLCLSRHHSGARRRPPGRSPVRRWTVVSGGRSSRPSAAKRA